MPPTRQSSRLRRERRTIEAMLRLYCKRQHPGQPTLCGDCSALLDYAHSRLARCPLQHTKPTCANCSNHCYKPSMQKRIRAVMRWAGPRMLLTHPLLTLLHLLDGHRASTRRDDQSPGT